MGKTLGAFGMANLPARTIAAVSMRSGFAQTGSAAMADMNVAFP
jgi:hypothetical protein